MARWRRKTQQKRDLELHGASVPQTHEQMLEDIRRVLQEVPPEQHQYRLEQAEQIFKREGNLALLRALKEYRTKHLPPTSTKPRLID